MYPTFFSSDVFLTRSQMLSIFINLLLFVHVLVCLMIVGIVLMQRPKNEGLGAAFGAGTTDALFGAQTSNVLASITRWLTGIFFVLTLVLSSLYARQGREKTGVEQRLQESAQPVPSALPTLPTVPVDGAAPSAAPSAPAVAPLVPPTPSLAPTAPTLTPSEKMPVPAVPPADAPKADAPKVDAPKVDAPKVDAPKADAPKADAPKADAPKVDAPKADAPKVDDAPKADAPPANPAPAPKPDGAPQQ